MDFPTLLSEYNFPKIKFRKITANRNQKLYVLLNFVKKICAIYQESRKIETGDKKDNPYRECEEICCEGGGEKNYSNSCITAL